MHEVYWREMSHEQLLAQVDERYNTLRQTLVITDNASFEEARERIKKGVLRPDFREEQDEQKQQ